MDEAILPSASIHGRFQPFHNGHLAYALAALRRSEFIYIGITRVLSPPAIVYENAPHRNRDEDNPFTYYQRSKIIRAALQYAGVPHNCYEVGPFPIEQVDQISEFWPKHLPCLTTIVDKWNLEKIDKLRTSGFEVEVLKDVVKSDEFVTSGSAIRRKMRDQDETWKDFVPAGGVECLVKAGWVLT